MAQPTGNPQEVARCRQYTELFCAVLIGSICFFRPPYPGADEITYLILTLTLISDKQMSDRTQTTCPTWHRILVNASPYSVRPSPYCTTCIKLHRLIRLIRSAFDSDWFFLCRGAPPCTVLCLAWCPMPNLIPQNARAGRGGCRACCHGPFAIHSKIMKPIGSLRRWCYWKRYLCASQGQCVLGYRSDLNMS
jgi:hypothetical protein